jgi:hypothetical protein
MATWFDIEKALADDSIESLDRETLEAFSRVDIPPHRNPSFPLRFQQAQARILRRLDQIAADDARSRQCGQDDGHDHWYKKPVGIVILSVAAGVILLLIKFILGF